MTEHISILRLRYLSHHGGGGFACVCTLVRVQVDLSEKLNWRPVFSEVVSRESICRGFLLRRLTGRREMMRAVNKKPAAFLLESVLTWQDHVYAFLSEFQIQVIDVPLCFFSPHSAAESAENSRRMVGVQGGGAGELCSR